MIKIALTGGPCAGKTTVTELLKKTFGNKVVVVPETATILLENLIPKPTNDLEFWMESLQKSIYPCQEVNEGIYTKIAEESNKKVVICDRGTIDGAAYIGIDRFEKLLNVSVTAELRKYDSIIFLNSVATIPVSGKQLWDDLKATNPARYETYDEAIEKNEALREIYSQHPNFYNIEATEGIEGVWSQILSLLHSYIDVEVERKWIYDSKDEFFNGDDFFSTIEKLKSSQICQCYIAAEEDHEVRVRRLDDKYYICVKTGNGLKRVEWERETTKAIFDSLYSGDYKRVEKTRFYLPYKGYTLEIDTYDTGLITIEVEFSSEEEANKFLLPITAEEVTGNPHYSNKALAS